MEVLGKPIYRLADVEIDPGRALVKRAGEEQYLRQQTLQVLIYLLERRERLVTKDELIEAVWQGVAVSDNALVQCIADIRRALGDDSRQPRFIRTFPKSGYRFVSTVEEIWPATTVASEPPPATSNDLPVLEAAEADRSDEAALVAVSPASRLTRRFVMLLAALLIALTATGLYLLRRPHAIPSLASVVLSQDPGKRAIAVMFFDNRSNSADLEWLREGLADMLITDLSRSKNLAVLSRQQLQLLLERIGHREQDGIRLDEALDIARRSQAKIVILGSFARLGDQIRVDVQLYDSRDGLLLTAERMVVEQPAQILTQIDLLCLKLASHLGAQSAEQKASAGLTSEMTNSLEAYRDYSLAVEKAQALHSEEAIALLQKAVALDPEFAMAHARIGYTYAVRWGRVDEGKPYLEKAFQLSGRLTERDRLNIAAWYAIANLDYAGAIKSFQEITTRYPLEAEAYQRLGGLLRGEDRAEEAIAVLKQGLVMDGGAQELYNELGGAYMELSRHDEAIAMFRHYVDLAPQEANAHDSLGSGYEWAGRYQEAIQEYSRALVLKPDFEIAVIHLGNAYFQQGRYREAIQQYQRYRNLTTFDFERGRGYNSIAAAWRMSGKLDEAERSATLATRYFKPSVAQLQQVALQKGDLRTAAKFTEVLKAYYFTGTYQTNRGAKTSLREPSFYQGNFELKNGHSAAAIAQFQEALKHRPPIWNFDSYEDCLANAYLELGRLDEAIAEYERILRLNRNYPLVHYHLAQAYERKGQRDQARALYEQFLEVWKDADPEVPEVVTARKMISVGAG